MEILELIIGIGVISFIAIVGYILYKKSKKKTPLGKGGSSGSNSKSDSKNKERV